MPKTKEQNEKIKSQRKQAIITSALELFATKGFENTSIDDIAKFVNCSHGLIYHYYKSKYEILDVILVFGEKWVNSFLIEQLSIEGNAYDKVLNLTEKLIVSLSNDKKLSNYFKIVLEAIIFQQTKTESTLFDKLINSQHFSRLIEIINQGKEEGIFINKDTDKLLKYYLMILKGILVDAIQHHYFGTLDDANIIVNLLVK